MGCELFLSQEFLVKNTLKSKLTNPNSLEKEVKMLIIQQKPFYSRPDSITISNKQD